MSNAMTAKEISEAWVKYVDDTFMFGDGSSRPDVVKELKRLEESGELGQTRERDRIQTDMYIAQLINSEPESRSNLYKLTGSMTLALVQDRIKSVTELLIGLVQQNVQIKIDEEQGLEPFFQQMLFQRPAHQPQVPTEQAQAATPEEREG